MRVRARACVPACSRVLARGRVRACLRARSRVRGSCNVISITLRHLRHYRVVFRLIEVQQAPGMHLTAIYSRPMHKM